MYLLVVGLWVLICLPLSYRSFHLVNSHGVREFPGAPSGWIKLWFWLCPVLLLVREGPGFSLSHMLIGLGGGVVLAFLCFRMGKICGIWDLETGWGTPER